MRSPEKKFAPFWLSYLLFFLACGSAWADVSGEITGVKLDPDQKRVVIESKGTVGKHLARVIGRPNRLVMYFDQMVIGKVPPTIKGGHLNISEIRSSNARGQARVVLDFQESPVPPFHVRGNGNSVFIIFGLGLKTDKGIEEFASQQPTMLSAPAAPELTPAAVTRNTSGEDTKNQFGAVASSGGIQAEKFVLNPAHPQARPVERSRSEKNLRTGASKPANNDSADAKKKLPILLAQNMDTKKSPPSPLGKAQPEAKGAGPIADSNPGAAE